MSTNVTQQSIQTRSVQQSSPPEQNTDEMDAYIPDSIPNTETTVYRNKKTVIRIRPSNASTSGVYLTMYCQIKGKLKFLTPEENSNWCDDSFDTSPNTIRSLPENIAERYYAIVETLIKKLDLSIVHPSTGYGICHRRHDSVGKYGVISFETYMK